MVCICVCHPVVDETVMELEITGRCPNRGMYSYAVFGFLYYDDASWWVLGYSAYFIWNIPPMIGSIDLVHRLIVCLASYAVLNSLWKTYPLLVESAYVLTLWPLTKIWCVFVCVTQWSWNRWWSWKLRDWVQSVVCIPMQSLDSYIMMTRGGRSWNTIHILSGIYHPWLAQLILTTDL